MRIRPAPLAFVVVVLVLIAQLEAQLSIERGYSGLQRLAACQPGACVARSLPAPTLAYLGCAPASASRRLIASATATATAKTLRQQQQQQQQLGGANHQGARLQSRLADLGSRCTIFYIHSADPMSPSVRLSVCLARLASSSIVCSRRCCRLIVGCLSSSFCSSLGLLAATFGSNGKPASLTSLPVVYFWYL